MSWANIEKRKFPRAKFPCRVTVFLPKEQIITSVTQNIGCGGIRIAMEEDIPIKTIVNLEIELPDEQTIKCKAKVVWKVGNKVPAGKNLVTTLFDMGLEFCDLNKTQQKIIEALVLKLVQEENVRKS